MQQHGLLHHVPKREGVDVLSYLRGRGCVGGVEVTYAVRFPSVCDAGATDALIFNLWSSVLEVWC